MSFRISIALLTLAWAAIYLPLLGERELKGEEPRRILPAIEMLETGDWIVPRLAGEVYANKPPLINWAIASLFALTGTTSEFAARMVSTLALLALSVSALLLLGKELGNERALLVGLVLLTTFAMIDKGRLIEIDVFFSALFGIACFLWIRLWLDQRSPWLIWTLPYLFLGLGCLLKGPVHLLFWLSFLISTLRFSREEKAAFHPAHLAGILLMNLIVIPWVVLNINAVGTGKNSTGTWLSQLLVRLDFAEFTWERFLTNPINIVKDLLPWSITLIYSLWKFRRDRLHLRRGTRDGAIVFGCLCTCFFGFLLVCLLPGGLPRYFMPVYPLAALATVSLYFRLADASRAPYEKLVNCSNYVLVPMFLLAPPALMFVAMWQGEPSFVIPILAGMVVVAGVSALILGPWKNRSIILKISLLIAAGALPLIPAVKPFIWKEESLRTGAAKIAAIVPAQARIAFYADRGVRYHRLQHLGHLYYLREPSVGFGESGILPLDCDVLVGRPEVEKDMLAKLNGRVVVRKEKTTINGLPLLVLFLDRPSSP